VSGMAILQQSTRLLLRGGHEAEISPILPSLYILRTHGAASIPHDPGRLILSVHFFHDAVELFFRRLLICRPVGTISKHEKLRSFSAAYQLIPAHCSCVARFAHGCTNLCFRSDKGPHLFWLQQQSCDG